MLLDLIFSLMKRMYLDVPNEISQALIFFPKLQMSQNQPNGIFNFKTTFPIVGWYFFKS